MRVPPTRLLLFLCVLTSPFTASSQGRYIRFECLVPEFQGNPIAGISSVIQDREGFLWFGTGIGLARYDGYNFNFYLPKSGQEDSLSSLAVYPVLEDRSGDIWIGTDRLGLFRFDKNKETFVQYRHNPDDPNSISGDIVLSIQEDSRGDLWVGTRLSGLNRFDKSAGTFARFPLNPEAETIWDLLVDRRGFLWIGTQSGLNRMDKTAGRCVRYISDIKNPPGESINNNVIHCIHEDKAGTLWLGTAGGMNRFDRTKGEWKYFSLKEGLPGDVVCGILEDESGFLWVSTNRGLSRFNPENEIFTNFKIHDGIQGNTFNPRASFKAADGKMFFGGVNGYNSFGPKEVKSNPFIPPVVWTAFYRNGQEVKIEGPLSSPRSLKLSSRFDVYAFEFAALCFVMPSLNRFAYKLEPRDREWIPLGQANTVTVSRLKLGEYRLHVKGSNPDGVWNENGFEIGIELVPPFWRTTWFAALVLLFVASGVATVVRMWMELKSAFMVVGDRADNVIESYGLTAREQEILRLILQGASNKDIERKLFISASTLRNHISNIYQKLGVGNRLELINLIGKDARKKA